MVRASRRRLRLLERELAKLEAHRAEIERTIARLRRAGEWLRRESLERTGRSRNKRRSLTDACRAALRTSRQPLTPLEVRLFLAHAGFDLDRFVNPMSAIHTVLKRLVRQNEAIERPKPAGGRSYAWRQVKVVALSEAQLQDGKLLDRLLAGATAASLERPRGRRPS